VEVGQWVQPPSTNTRIRVIQANAPSFRFYVPPYVDSAFVSAADALIRFTPDFSVGHTHGIAAYGAFDACCSAFHSCTLFSRGCNGSCGLCLLLNSDAYWSGRKAKFVGEEKCYRGLTVEHAVMVPEFMEGVIGRMVEEGKKKAVERVEKAVEEEGAKAVGEENGGVEEKGVEGKGVGEGQEVVEGTGVEGEREAVEGKSTNEEEVGDQSGFRAGARRTQPPADGIPSSGLSAGCILASPPSLPAGSADAHNLQESNSVEAAVERQASEDEMEQAFGHNLGFPTTRRPIEYRRTLNGNVNVNSTVMEEWLEASGITIGADLDQHQREKAMQLLWTWKDIFCDDLATLPATDLIYHRIPTRRDCRPVRSKPRLSTAEEVAWLREHIPAMEKAGIIDRVDSPWSAPSRFVRKKNNSLRLTHTFCPINDATIKSNYPMQRVEPILNNLMQPRFSMFGGRMHQTGTGRCRCGHSTCLRLHSRVH
jgi:hypothetical protein